VYQRYFVSKRQVQRRRSTSGSPEQRNLCALCFRASVYGLAPNALVLLARPQRPGAVLFAQCLDRALRKSGVSHKVVPWAGGCHVWGFTRGGAPPGRVRTVHGRRGNIAVVLLDAENVVSAEIYTVVTWMSFCEGEYIASRRCQH